MKTKNILFSTLVLFACGVQGQTPSGQGAVSSGQAAGQSGQGSQRVGVQGQQINPRTKGNTATPPGINQPANQPGINQPLNPNDQRNLLPNQPGNRGGISPDAPTPFNKTNQLPATPTNQVPFGTTNRVPFGAPNQIPFGGTNRTGASATGTGTSVNTAGNIVTDPSGATVNQNGFALPPVNANGAGDGTLVNGNVNANGNGTGVNGQANPTGGNTEEVFQERLRASLAQTGATKIFFPQTRSAITVVNQSGTVTLTGSVGSETEKQSIESRIRKTQGVVNVQNQLQVSAGGLKPDQRQTPSSDPKVRFP